MNSPPDVPQSLNFVSPPRRRQRGGRRPGAGRKKKTTPVKKDVQASGLVSRRAFLRLSLINTLKDLATLRKQGQFGAQYQDALAKHLEISKRLGLVKPDATVSNAHIDSDAIPSSSDDQESEHSEVN
jgi:hypothetical protein